MPSENPQPQGSQEKLVDPAPIDGQRAESSGLNVPYYHEINNQTEGLFNEDNRSLFQKISEGGRSIAHKAYEGLYRIPVVNRVVGKMEIAYNQFWIDRHEEKAVEFKKEAVTLDQRVVAIDNSKIEVERIINDLKKQNIPGVESLQIKLRDFENQRLDLLNEQNKFQTKFEARANKMKLYASERDQVANKLIEKFEEKIGPMEKELTNLNTCRDELDLTVAVAEIKHKEASERLTSTENKKTQIIDALKRSGMSDKEIKNFEAVKELDEYIAQGREDIKRESAILAQRKIEIERKIAKVDRKANPYRDKREEFIRIKQGRPIDIDMETRRRSNNVEYGEDGTTSHTRLPSEEVESRSDDTPEVSEPETSSESQVEKGERDEIGAFVHTWNEYVKKRYGKDASKEIVDIRDFCIVTRLSENYKMDRADFKKIFEKYFKFRKIPTDKLSKVK